MRCAKFVMGEVGVLRSTVGLPRRDRVRDGRLPLVALTGAVAVAVLWGVSANDPYWRLFETPTVPAPDYEAPQDLQAALEAAPPLGNADTGAVSPAVAPLDATPEAFPMADAAPVIVPRADDVSDDGRRLATVELSGDSPADAPAVPLPAPLALHAPNTSVVGEVVTIDTLDPFAVPTAPAQPRVAADEATEDALALDRTERMDVQRRLALAGFDPEGFDGVFGPRTRDAIADFQTAWSFPATGYLDAAVYADLGQRTEDAYEALRRRAEAAPAAAPKLAPPPQQRERPATEDDELCARRSDGQIIARQGIACDLAGLAEKFISLGRSTLDHDGDIDDGAAVAQQATLTPPENDR
jgi:hypothetical protein